MRVETDINQWFKCYCKHKGWRYGESVDFNAWDYMRWLDSNQEEFYKSRVKGIEPSPDYIYEKNYYFQYHKKDFEEFLIKKYGTI